MFTRRRQRAVVPEVGDEAREFNLPSAQGGQLRLSMRTARGPVVVVFFRGVWSEEDLAYFKALAAKEDEINYAGASVVGVGILEPEEAREFVRETGMKSYILYDYVRVTTRQWGLLEKDKEHGEYARPTVFIVGGDHKIAQSWIGERPAVEEILAKITEITGLPKAPEEQEPEEAAGDEKGGEKPKKMSAEERERIKAERRAAREAGKSVKTQRPDGASEKASGDEGPKKMSAEEREKIKAERRAAREAGKSLKTGTPEEKGTGEAAPEPSAGDAPKKMTAEERERIKAERRAAREAGKSLKKPAAQAESGGENAAASTEAKEPATPDAGKSEEE
ncbi:MAG TPA: redoxin domain-containing protein [Rubrobacteraceae bacterium]|nr:redoxin domain-containing protein [Rubrobacteraceae bacterium]